MGTKLDYSGQDKDYVDAIYKLAECIIIRIRCPWQYYDFIHNLSWSGYKERKYVKVLHRFTDAVIKEREKNFDQHDLDNIENIDGFKPKKRLAMLDLLIDCKRRGQIDDAGIREEVDTFMFEVFIDTFT